MRRFSSWMLASALLWGISAVPGFAQSTASRDSSVKDGISVTGVGHVESYARHVLQIVPNRVAVIKQYLPKLEQGRARSSSSEYVQSHWVTEDQAKPIADDMKAVQASLVQMLDGLKLGKLRLVPDTAGPPFLVRFPDQPIYDPRAVRHKLAPDLIFLDLTQKTCNGETFGPLTRRLLLAKVNQISKNYTIILESIMKPEDVSTYDLAVSRAIANGRSAAEKIAKAGGVKIGKLLAAQRISLTGPDDRYMTLTEDRATVTTNGGVSVAFSLRFQIL